jgi:hypothetical protein
LKSLFERGTLASKMGIESSGRGIFVIGASRRAARKRATTGVENAVDDSGASEQLTKLMISGAVPKWRQPAMSQRY